MDTKNNAVMISVCPQMCRLILPGTRTMEPRLMKPALTPPFVVYIYQTKTMYNAYWEWTQDKSIKRDSSWGKVIGEFLCNDIQKYPCTRKMLELLSQAGTGISEEELLNYCNGKDIYLWGISDLKVYDHLKNLTDFYKADFLNGIWYRSEEVMKRPPPSWCYTEEKLK